MWKKGVEKREKKHRDACLRKTGQKKVKLKEKEGHACVFGEILKRARMK